MEKEKIKILAIGDIHGDTGLVKRLVNKTKKENVDLVILAGDLTFTEKSIKNIIGPFIKTNKPIFLIPGNHESAATADALAQIYGAKNLHGYGFVENGIGFFGAGAADIGPFPVSSKEIFELLNKGNKDIKNAKKKIMVTHMHPQGGQADKFGFIGSKAIKKAIERFKPDIAINAHIHEAGGIEEKIGKTRVINVSRKEKIFEI